MTKVYYFTKHTFLGASSRYRSIQYFNSLRSAGIVPVHYPLFSDNYLRLKYNHNKLYYIITVWSIFLRILLSMYILVKDDGLVVIEKELIPYFPPILEWLFHKRGLKFILDYDDAVWHNYDRFKNSLFSFLAVKHKMIIGYSSKVICGSSYIYKYANDFGGKKEKCIKIPTVVNLLRYQKPAITHTENVVIGWIGSPSSSQYLDSLIPVLNKLANHHDFTVHLIGAYSNIMTGNDFKVIALPWSIETEIDNIFNFDIGIMPLKNANYEQGKCAFKLIQYMAAYKPVVCSPVGENVVLVEHNVNGYVAKTDEDWHESLSLLIRSPELRIKLGTRGREKIASSYCLDSAFPTYQNVIQQMLE